MTSLSLLVPVYNESKHLNDITKKIFAVPNVSEIVFVDDGSKDNSTEILEELKLHAKGKVKILTHPKNRGKGGAIQTGIAATDSDFLVIQDADLEYDVNDLAPIFDALVSKKADVVFGSRFLKTNPNIYPLYLWGNKFLTFVINFLSGGSLTDSYTGYKGMSTALWRSLALKSNGFEIEAEISTKCLMRKLKILEIPISYNPRTFSEGKKIRAKDALKGIAKALQCRLHL